MRLLAATSLLSVMCLSFSACRGTQQPRMAYPGSVAQQQHEAQIHDPFPELETGPELLGARPRDYDEPYSATRRVQTDRWLRSPWNPVNWFGGY